MTAPLSQLRTTLWLLVLVAAGVRSNDSGPAADEGLFSSAGSEVPVEPVRFGEIVNFYPWREWAERNNRAWSEWEGGRPRGSGPTMWSTPPQVNGQQGVVITAAGLPPPPEWFQGFEMVTLSCGPSSGPLDYMDHAVVNRTSNSTTAQVTFGMLAAMRCNFSFAYLLVEWFKTEPTVVASVDVPVTVDPEAPAHGHLALSGIPGTMWVSYTTATAAPTPTVVYGRSPAALDQQANGSSVTYAPEDLCEAPANTTSQSYFRDPGFMHHVLLTGLEPATSYYYRFGNDAGGWSDVYSFVSPPPPSSSGVRFLAYADMGLGAAPGSLATTELALQQIQEGGYDSFLLHFGDIAYALGHGYVWELWMSQQEPVASRVPYLVSVGNHEYDHASGGAKDPSGAPGNGFHPSWGNMGDDSRGECGVPVSRRFRSPANGNGVFWYSFDYGDVHVVQISSEHDWTPGAPQYEWLVGDLSSVNRSVTPWVVLTSHRMMYTTQLFEFGDKIVSIAMQESLDALLYKYGVNLMLSGHQHSYERSCPVYNLTCRDPGHGTVHIVVGTAGATLQWAGFSALLGNWSVVHTHVHNGFLRLDTSPERLHVEFIANDVPDTPYDEVDILPWAAWNYS